jgi:hypothetical protein
MAHSLKTQQGAALLVFAAILVIGGSWWLLAYAVPNLNRHTVDGREHNARMLSLAKQALIGYVAHRVNHPANPFADRERHPGRLPCPEANGSIGGSNEGEAANVCTLPAVGRLPWKTLGIDQLRDAAGEPLWYVVSEGWTLTATSGPGATLALNSNTRGQLTVDGQANAAAALLIAPGPALLVQTSTNCAQHGQARAAPAPGIDRRNYLECQNATTPADATFATAGPSGSFNDQVLAVSAADIWSVVEGAVATRLQRDVMPVLEAAFAAPYTSDAQWGGSVSATRPMLPFALPFADNSMQPYQGGLPLWRSQGCTAGTDALCDPSFVHWAVNDPDPAAYPNPSVVKTAFGNTTANIDSANCMIPSTPSNSQQVRCTISYSRLCGGGLNLGYLLGGRCWVDLEVSVLARAKNVGRALRTFTAAPVSVSESPWSLVSSATPINSAGDAAADIRLQLPPASCNCTIVLCVLLPCAASNTVDVTVPIAIFQDHPALTPVFNAGTDWEWFIENRWYDAMYYAVAPRHAPGGSPHDCRPNNCLGVNGANLPVRALIAMTGYSMNNLARPSTNFNDYLDSSENRDGDRNFEQKMAGRSFNDRFFSASAYPAP